MTNFLRSRIEYYVYQPRIAVDVEFSLRRDGDRFPFVIGSAFMAAA
jgi:hypothetical protein